MISRKVVMTAATGESTAAIYARMNDRAWQTMLPLMRAGAALKRERTGSYYADGRGGITAARVKRLERDGVIRRVGIDTYALVDVL